jgi:hypothetical protein
MPTPRPDLESAHELACVDIQGLPFPTALRYEACSVLRARARVGWERYQAVLTPNNGRDGQRDAVEEAADLVAYLQCGVREGWCRSWTYDNAVGVFMDLVAGAGHWLNQAVADRGRPE